MKLWMLVVSILGLSLASVWADEVETVSGVIAVSDGATLKNSLEKEVTVEGVCTEAAWSATGKVMNVRFRDTKESRFNAVVFVKNRQKMDAAFDGDVAKALSGQKIRLKGILTEYSGRDEKRKGEPQIILNEPNQITIFPAEPATRPVGQ
jgi:DNA/RNA endonuclease YhcR with UshA esterase domain